MNLSGTTASHTERLFTSFGDRQEDALRLCPENSLDNRGLIFALITDAFFLTRFGAAKEPRVHPGLPGGTRVELTINANDLKAYMLQQALIARLRAHMLKEVPSFLFEQSKDEYGSLEARSLLFLCNSLIEQVGTLAQADIADLYVKLNAPYVHGEHIEAFVAVRRDLFRQLAAINEAIPVSMQLTTIRKCMEGPLDFTICWVTFAKDFPLVADQTLERLFAAITHHVNVNLPLLATKADLHMNAAVLAQQEMAEIKAELAGFRRLFLAQTGVPAPLVPRGKSKPRGKRSHLDGPRVPFCWTHGPCWHIGAGCDEQGVGHKEAATWTNQMKSPWKALWHSQGRQTE